MMQRKNPKKGFSLIELSIVILIISILMVGGLGISKSSLSNSKTKVTKERMDIIYKALGNFVAQNRRLPCPALLAVAKGTSNYGDEATTPGTCDTFVIGSQGGGETQELVYGMVPIKALGLDTDVAEDGFGTKFSYVVDRRFTKTSSGTAATDGFEMTKAMPNGNGVKPIIAIVRDAANSPLMDNAVFLLISHGANKFLGWNASGTARNPDSAVSQETTNGGSSILVDGFDENFFASSNDSNFDDIVLFKNKTQLTKDAGLEFIMCNKDEATTESISSTVYSWSAGALYGCSLSSGFGVGTNTTFCAKKTCGKYGVWSTVLSTPAAGQCAVSSCDITTMFVETYNNGAQSIANTTSTAVAFNTDSGNFGSRSPNSQFRPTKAGYWLISYTIYYTENSTGTRATYIRKNGSGNDSDRIAFSEVGANAFSGSPYFSGTGLTSSAVIYFNGTSDYLEIMAYQSSGGALNIGATTPHYKRNSLTMHYLHP